MARADAPEELTARFLLAADGASSFVRRQHGIRLLDQGFDEPWMVIDVMCERELGDGRRVRDVLRSTQTGDPDPWSGPSPPLGVHAAARRDTGLIQQPEAIAELLAPWVTMDEVQILRAAVYTFHALVAERWREGRVVPGRRRGASDPRVSRPGPLPRDP